MKRLSKIAMFHILFSYIGNQPQSELFHIFLQVYKLVSFPLESTSFYPLNFRKNDQPNMSILIIFCTYIDFEHILNIF